MPTISRRDLLSSGLALSASSLVARSAWARAAAALTRAGQDAQLSGATADSPREFPVHVSPLAT